MHTHYPFYFFLTDTSPTEIYTLSLHDALPISAQSAAQCRNDVLIAQEFCEAHQRPPGPAFWNTCVEMIGFTAPRSEEHTSELQSRVDLVCRLLLEKKKKKIKKNNVN